MSLAIQDCGTGSASASTSVLTLAAAAALAACGGSDAPPPAFFRIQEAPTQRLLSAATASAAVSLPSPTELLDWAERRYPEYFPDHQQDVSEAPYVYRGYPATGNYVGVAGADVYVLGPLSDNQLVRVGALADFAALVQASTVALSDEAAARFLQQAQVSSRLEDIAAVRAQGYAPWLEGQMAMQPTQSAWEWLVSRGYAEVNEGAYYDGPGAPLIDRVLGYQMATAPDAVRKRAALAWSEIFVVSTLMTLSWPHLAMAHYWDQLNGNAFGSFRKLLEDMTLNPAMGAWLNTKGNLKEDPVTGRQPDENYAREVMQLFTIGLVQLNLDGTPKRDAAGQPIPTFTQDDVSQLARVFTGYDLWDDGRRFIAPATNNERMYPGFTNRPMVLDAGKHSQLGVSFLGTQIPPATDAARALRMALDTLFNHPNVGPFIARQMIQRLVTGNPSPAYVARVAAKFNNNGSGVRGDLGALHKAILLDDEARIPGAVDAGAFGKVREPMVRVFQWARTFGASSRSGTWAWGFNYEDPASWFGQRPLWASSVFNFFRPGYVPPGTALAPVGATAPEFQILNESTVSQWINFIDGLNLAAGTAAYATGDVAIDLVAEAPLALDPPALLSRLNLLLCAGQLSASTQARIVDILMLSGALSAQSPDEFKRYRAIAAITLVMSCPEYIVQK